VITQEWLKTYFKYMKGNLYQIKNYNQSTTTRKLFKPVGCLDDGYLITIIEGKKFRVSHLIWLYKKGTLPPKGKILDHKNLKRNDNRIVNLRLATRAENNRNRDGFKRVSKFKGVSKNSQSKNFAATIAVDRKKIHIGSFDTEEKAAVAYNKAARKFHGKFARLNKIK